MVESVTSLVPAPAFTVRAAHRSITSTSFRNISRSHRCQRRFVAYRATRPKPPEPAPNVRSRMSCWLMSVSYSRLPGLLCSTPNAGASVRQSAQTRRDLVCRLHNRPAGWRLCPTPGSRCHSQAAAIAAELLADLQPATDQLDHRHAGGAGAGELAAERAPEPAVAGVAVIVHVIPSVGHPRSHPAAGRAGLGRTRPDEAG